MCPNKPDIHGFRSKLNENNQSVVVTFDVKHISLVAYCIHAVECVFNVSETSPFRLLGFLDRSGDGSLICYYSLNNPVTDARYSGQLSESCSLVAYLFYNFVSLILL